ncbi:MAG: OmpA family protein [Saprospiraceae bacterium]|nr:OmpA family protein [Saprospiraceae bacterium]
MRVILLLAWAIFTGLCAFLQNKFCCNVEPASAAVNAEYYSDNFQLSSADGWSANCKTSSFLKSSNQLLPNEAALSECLSAIAEFQTTHPEQTWEIIGNYAPFESNSTIFNTLGQARAQQIKQQLVEAFGMDGTLLNIQGNIVDSSAFKQDTLLYGYFIKMGASPSQTAKAPTSEGETGQEDTGVSENKSSPDYIAQFDRSQPIVLRFATNSSIPQLNASIRGQFAQLLSDLDNFNDLNVKVIGHTDTVGEASSNLTLGMERAQSIKDYLINNGLAANRIALDSKGESQPISQDDAINRRVEVTVE